MWWSVSAYCSYTQCRFRWVCSALACISHVSSLCAATQSVYKPAGVGHSNYCHIGLGYGGLCRHTAAALDAALDESAMLWPATTLSQAHVLNVCQQTAAARDAAFSWVCSAFACSSSVTVMHGKNKKLYKDSVLSLVLETAAMMPLQMGLRCFCLQQQCHRSMCCNIEHLQDSWCGSAGTQTSN